MDVSRDPPSEAQTLAARDPLIRWDGERTGNPRRA